MNLLFIAAENISTGDVVSLYDAPDPKDGLVLYRWRPELTPIRIAVRDIKQGEVVTLNTEGNSKDLLHKTT